MYKKNWEEYYSTMETECEKIQADIWLYVKKVGVNGP